MLSIGVNIGLDDVRQRALCRVASGANEHNRRNAFIASSSRMYPRFHLSDIHPDDRITG